MGTPRNVYKYHFKLGRKIVHRGITVDLERRTVEHRRDYPLGHIKKVGRRTTREAAFRWRKR